MWINARERGPADLTVHELLHRLADRSIRLRTVDEQIREVLKAARRLPPWWPDAVLLGDVLKKAWIEHSHAYRTILANAFIEAGDGAFRMEDLPHLRERGRRTGKEMAKAVSGQIDTIFNMLIPRVLADIKRRAEGVKKIDDASVKARWDQLLLERQKDCIELFIERAPDQVFHPEIERLARLLQLNPQARGLDKDTIQDRLLRVANSELYWDEMARVNVGRLWAGESVLLAEKYGATTFRVAAVLDDATCSVCVAMHGREFAVADSAQKYKEFLKLDVPDAEAIKVMFPFPRTRDIDNRSPEAVSKLGAMGMPPYHPSCRCQVLFVGLPEGTLNYPSQTVEERIPEEKLELWEREPVDAPEGWQRLPDGEFAYVMPEPFQDHDEARTWLLENLVGSLPDRSYSFPEYDVVYKKFKDIPMDRINATFGPVRQLLPHLQASGFHKLGEINFGSFQGAWGVCDWGRPGVQLTNILMNTAPGIAKQQGVRQSLIRTAERSVQSLTNDLRSAKQLDDKKEIANITRKLKKAKKRVEVLTSGEAFFNGGQPDRTFVGWLHGKFGSINDSAKVMIHEMGHSMHAWFEKETKDYFGLPRLKLKNRRYVTTLNTPKLKRMAVSKYGQKNFAENMADSFYMYTSGHTRFMDPFFVEFYDEMYPTLNFGQTNKLGIKLKGSQLAAEWKPKVIKLPPHEQVVREVFEKLAQTGIEGRSIPFDLMDFEDQNMRIFLEHLEGGGQNMFAKLKLREESNDRFVEMLEKYFGRKERVALKEDKYFEKIQDATKSLIMSSEYSPSRALRMLQKGTQDLHDSRRYYEEVFNKVAAKRRITRLDMKKQAMAKHYMENIDYFLKRFDEGRLSFGHVDGFEKYMYEKRIKAAAQSDLFTVTKDKVRMNLHKVVDGKLTREADDTFLEYFMGQEDAKYAAEAMKGTRYKITFKDGTEINYLPYPPKDFRFGGGLMPEHNPYGLGGRMNINVKGTPSRESLQQIQNALKELGLNSELATAADQEYMYLMKQGRLIPNHKRGHWNEIIARHEAENLAINDRVEEMVDYWNTALKPTLDKAKVKTIRDLPWYQPEGVWETHYKTGEKIGEKLYYRFDVSPEQWAKDQKKLLLYHDPGYGRGTRVADFLDKALGGTPNLLSNDAKLMKGIPIYGGSPIEDMRSGGTNYAFTRWMPEKDRSHRGVYFKRDLGRRMDAISYDHDSYGKVTGDYVSTHMVNAKTNGVSDTFRVSNRPGGNKISFNWSNETLFKGEVNLVNHLERVVVRNPTEYQRCMDVFRKYGLETLPDGRKAEDLIFIWKEQNTGFL